MITYLLEIYEPDGTFLYAREKNELSGMNQICKIEDEYYI